jgi:dTMP kinase
MRQAGSTRKKNKMSGYFISFEGGEGSGKTTQINRLSEFMTAQKNKIITTREPGGTPESEKIRDFLVKRDGGNWSPEAEVLLLYAARSMHVSRVIKPALQEGITVITDRFSDSTIAYQGYGHDYPLEKINALDDIILSGFKPDITFILDIPAADGIARSSHRLSKEANSFDRMEDRFEQLHIAFHEKLRQGFLTIAKQNPARCHVINAAQDIDSVTLEIQNIIKAKIQ